MRILVLFLPLCLLINLLPAQSFYFGPPIATGGQGEFLDDVDGDGDLDLIRQINYPAAPTDFVWAENAGDGTFVAGTQPVATMADTLSNLDPVLHYDVDGDGLKDIVIGSATNHRVQWIKRTTSAPFFAAPATIVHNSTSPIDPALPAYPQFIEMGDVSGDGIADLVISTLNGQLWWLPGSGGGSFAAPVKIANAVVDALTLGDISRGPAEEIVFATPGGSGSWIGFYEYEVDNFVNMHLALTSILPPGGGFSNPITSFIDDIELKDINEDGDPDLLLAREGAWFAGNDQFDAGNPSVHFTFDNSINELWSGPATGATQIALHDIDNDGDQDVFFTGDLSGTGVMETRFYEDQGATLGAQIDFAFSTAGPVGDLDGNGKQDVVDGTDRHPFREAGNIRFHLAFGGFSFTGVPENGGANGPPVILSVAQPTDLTVNFAVATDPTYGPPAVAGVDYNASLSYVIPAGEVFGVFDVNPIDNSILNDGRFFTATITSTDNPDVEIIPVTAIISIEDDEFVLIGFTDADVSENAGSVAINWNVQTNVPGLGAFDFDWKTQQFGSIGVGGGPIFTGPFDAEGDLDYAHAEGTVNVPAGTTSGSFNVTILDDTIPELDEQFTIEFTKPGSIPTNMIINIIDDEPDPTGFYAATIATGLGGSAAGPEADPDGDGVYNLVAYGLGILPPDPAYPERGAPRLLEGGPAGTPMEYTFCQPNPAPSDVIYIVETSPDAGRTIPYTEIARREGAGPWIISDPAVTVETEPASGATDCVIVENTDWVSLPRDFIRLTVQLVD